MPTNNSSCQGTSPKTLKDYYEDLNDIKKYYEANYIARGGGTLSDLPAHVRLYDTLKDEKYGIVIISTSNIYDGGSVWVGVEFPVGSWPDLTSTLTTAELGKKISIDLMDIYLQDCH